MVSPQRLDLWAGVECTVNRVENSYSDQLERSGHTERSSDLKRLAGLGIRTLRYPILWERTAPDGLKRIDWSWTDDRMGQLQELGIKPIVGLLHHGSGPRYTNLLDSSFPDKLSEYAAAVAERYPFVVDYTPVNEPLTTARFSCLYGHWYPHATDALSFARALLNQCRGTALAMREIRKVNSGAQLIQTEDLGKTSSTRTLSYQAEFENERRWLTFDLLSGNVIPDSPMWNYLRWVGISENELEWFISNQTPPNIIGLNHYITSERFLDERLTRYPGVTCGGNQRHRYVDVEAVRVLSEGIAGPRAIIREAWERYRLPLAITEAHLGCTREEQLRWLKEVWDAAKDCRSNGVDVRAVTAWSAFGAYDWDTLLTSADGHYETGIFDLRAPAPRPTAVAQMVKNLAAGIDYDHPTLDSVGWWHRFDRLSYPAVHYRGSSLSASLQAVNKRGSLSRALLITGATGTLGKAFARICEMRGLAFHLLPRQRLDISCAEAVEEVLDQLDPWAVINAAGYVRVDDAERDSETCRRENTLGPTILARACARRDKALVNFSSDLVFDGRKKSPYLESDRPMPLNVYGSSKLEAERAVLNEHEKALVIRTSAFFGPWDEFNFVHAVIETLASGRSFAAARDSTISPTYVPDLVNATLDLLIDGEHGIWHLSNSGAVTWAEFAEVIANMAGYSTKRIEARSARGLGLVARRPSFSVLESERSCVMPQLEQGLNRYFMESRHARMKSFASAKY